MCYISCHFFIALHIHPPKWITHSMQFRFRLLLSVVVTVSMAHLMSESLLLSPLFISARKEFVKDSWSSISKDHKHHKHAKKDNSNTSSKCKQNTTEEGQQRSLVLMTCITLPVLAFVSEVWLFVEQSELAARKLARLVGFHKTYNK